MVCFTKRSATHDWNRRAARQNSSHWLRIFKLAQWYLGRERTRRGSDLPVSPLKLAVGCRTRGWVRFYKLPVSPGSPKGAAAHRQTAKNSLRLRRQIRHQRPLFRELLKLGSFRSPANQPIWVRIFKWGPRLAVCPPSAWVHRPTKLASFRKNRDPPESGRLFQRPRRTGGLHP